MIAATTRPHTDRAWRAQQRGPDAIHGTGPHHLRRDYLMTQPNPDGERIDLTAQVAAICAGLEADMTQAEYRLHAREAIGNDLIARACDGDDTEFLARRALRILCDGTDMPALRVDLLAVAR